MENIGWQHCVLFVAKLCTSLLQNTPELAKSYRVINRLKWAIRNRRFTRFTHVLEESKKYTYPHKIRTALNTLKKYIHSIENSFIYTLSNGPIEGLNNKVKNIKRSGYGYRNFRNLRSRIMISCTLKRESLKNKPLYFDEKEAQ